MSLRHSGGTILAVILGIASALAAQTSRDYPGWRGPNRDGGASGFVRPASWPDRMTMKWRTDVGEGYGTPLVVGDTAYVFTRRDGNEVMQALSVETGKLLWQTGSPVAAAVADAAAKHGLGPKATPLYHRGRLYALGISGILSAFDAASGKRLWQTAPPAKPPFYGAASSPLGYEQLVIVHPGSYGPLTAFDVETGTVTWTLPGDGFYSSPVLAEFGGVRQIVTILQDRVIGVTPEGTRLWEHPYKALGGATTPLVHDGLVIVSGQQMGVAAIRPVNRNGQWSAEAAWEIKEVSMFMSNPVAIGATLYGLSHRNSGQLFAVDVASGKVVWLGEAREAENTALVKAGSLLFLLHDDGELIVADAGPSGIAPVKRYTVSESATWAQPAISGARVFVKDARTLALWTWTP